VSTTTIRTEIGPARAEKLLDDYCSSASKNAWPLYDEDYAPDLLCGADLTATALLSYAIPGRYLNKFNIRQATNDDRHYERLLEAMEDFLAHPAGLRFADLHPDVVAGKDGEAPPEWQAFRACLTAVQPCKGLWSTAVTKILHRKRPDLVPINDSLVRRFYKAGSNYTPLFVSIHGELNDDETSEMLEKLGARHTTPSGRPMTQLRALDIIVWMHEKGLSR
jgi:hypothetical protein